VINQEFATKLLNNFLNDLSYLNKEPVEGEAGNEEDEIESLE
jgi:hypothetical protein